MFFSIRLHHALVLCLLEVYEEDGPIAAIKHLRDRLMYGPLTFGLCELKSVIDALNYEHLDTKNNVYIEVQVEPRRPVIL